MKALENLLSSIPSRRTSHPPSPTSQPPLLQSPNLHRTKAPLKIFIALAMIATAITLFRDNQAAAVMVDAVRTQTPPEIKRPFLEFWSNPAAVPAVAAAALCFHRYRNHVSAILLGGASTLAASGFLDLDLFDMLFR